MIMPKKQSVLYSVRSNLTVAKQVDPGPFALPINLFRNRAKRLQDGFGHARGHFTFALGALPRKGGSFNGVSVR